ncbi:MAG: transcriptional regulator [Tardiphaga sp.]|jgi:DNA-binding MarR family transcriptional regulator|nr:transcriptional regulator [Tardiphaga sp.]
MVLGSGTVCWQMKLMTLKPMKPTRRTRSTLPKPDQLAPVTEMVSSRLMVLANLLKRGAVLRYRRTAGLSSVEFGLVASLGRHPPMSVIQLAGAVGMDKSQISRALSGLVERDLVSRQVNPKDNREVLVALTRTGIVAHEILVAGAVERSENLLEEFGDDEVMLLLRYIDRLTDKAAAMLQEEKDRA